MTPLQYHLDSIYPLSKGAAQYLEQATQRHTLVRKEYLLTVGQRCKHLYFVSSGLLRCYSVEHNFEVHFTFAIEGELCTAARSFYMQEASEEYIQALEPTIVYSISYEDLQHLYSMYPEINFTFRVITENKYLLSEMKLNAIRLKRSYERYAWLMYTYPELIQRVPAKYLASYLGMTEVMLSMLKGKWKILPNRS